MVRVSRTVKEDLSRRLSNVPEENVFWLHDGRVLKNMEDLREAFNTMSDETYNYHVTAEKNDFYNWVKDVIGDTTLANNLLKARNRAEAARYVSRRIGAIK